MISRSLSFNLHKYFCVSKFSGLLYENSPQSLQKAAKMFVYLERQQQMYQRKIKRSQKYINSDQHIDNEILIEKLTSEIRQIGLAVQQKHLKELELIKKYGIAQMAQEVIKIADSINKSISQLKTNNQTNQQLNQSTQLLSDIISEFGIKQFNPLGEKFDPTISEAVGQFEDGNRVDGTVSRTIQTGYTIFQRLLRVSKVQVTQKNK